MNSKELEDTAIGMRNYTSVATLPALNESTFTTGSPKRKRKSKFKRSQKEMVSEVPYENYLNSRDYVIVKNRAKFDTELDTVTIEPKATAVRDTLRKNVEVVSHFSQ